MRPDLRDLKHAYKPGSTSSRMSVPSHCHRAPKTARYCIRVPVTRSSVTGTQSTTIPRVTIRTTGYSVTWQYKENTSQVRVKKHLGTPDDPAHLLRSTTSPLNCSASILRTYPSPVTSPQLMSRRIDSGPLLMDRSFSVTTEGLLKALATPCHISQAFNPANGVPECSRIEFKAYWDTGATKSVITPRVVEACGLKPLRRMKPAYLQGVNGFEKSEVYGQPPLPSKITFHELTVVLKDPGLWWDALIGMDVIAAGEFSVKNVNSNTEWVIPVLRPVRARSETDGAPGERLN
jgi:hypothetical protein